MKAESEDLYLVTGAAGFLGRTIVQQLVAAGKKVRGLVMPHEHHIPRDIEIIEGDVRDCNSLKPFFEKSGDQNLIVIHCAAIVSIASRFNQKMYDVNVGGTKNIVDLCQKYKVRKLIHVSSVHAIPEPANGGVITEVSEFDPEKVTGPYSRTKAEAGNYVLSAARKGLNVSIVQPSGILGPGDYGSSNMVSLVIDYIKHRLTSAVRGGYDFVDVRDVAKGVISCISKGRQGQCYILSNKFYKISEILDMLSSITGQKKMKSYLQLWFVKLTAPLAELYYKILKRPPLFTSYSIYVLGSNGNISHAKADKELDYTTRDMYETLNDTVRWLKKIKKI